MSGLSCDTPLLLLQGTWLPHDGHMRTQVPSMHWGRSVWGGSSHLGQVRNILLWFPFSPMGDVETVLQRFAVLNLRQVLVWLYKHSSSPFPSAPPPVSFLDFIFQTSLLNQPSCISAHFAGFGIHLCCLCYVVMLLLYVASVDMNQPSVTHPTAWVAYTVRGRLFKPPHYFDNTVQW